MNLTHTQDLHFIALCLTHGLATPEKIRELLERQKEFPEATLGELLVHDDVITDFQRQTVLDQVVLNSRLASVLSGNAAPAAKPIGDEESDELHHESVSAALTMSTTPPEDLVAITDRQRWPGGQQPKETSQSAAAAESGSGRIESRASATPNAGSAGSVGAGSLSSLGRSLDSITGGGRTGTGASFAELFRRRVQPDEVVGSEIAGYVIEGRLGRGGQGQVFSARQLSLDRLVALKVMPPELASNENFVNRFIREARTLATFTHPNIVQVYDVGVSEGVFYFTMEAVQGQTLREMLKAQGRVPMEVAVNLVKQCLRGLDRAARAEIIHRDIKPGNILIDGQGIVKLVDFGLAEHVVEMQESSEVVGTPLFISPEQIHGKAITSRADQYSLGATFYYLLTGHPPFHANDVRTLLRKHLDEPRPDPCASAPELLPDLAALVQRMMAVNPEDRYPDFQTLFRELEDLEIRHGFIESRSSFLAEGLMNIGERSVRNLWSNLALFAMVGVTYTVTAIAIGVTLKRLGKESWLDWSGNIGATLMFLAFVAIMMIAGIRKKWLPKMGNVRVWLQTHIVMALVGFFLSIVHSGNFFAFFTGAQQEPIPGQPLPSYHLVPIVPFLNSVLFTVVIISGLVGRYIWRDIAKQVAAERIEKGQARLEENHEVTLAIFAQRALRNWRIFHYPLAFALVVVTAVHIVSILYFGGKAN
ncbi:MAG: serine/threonine-protein kinase [Candidatus Sumerlaeaceae bacterium]